MCFSNVLFLFHPPLLQTSSGILLSQDTLLATKEVPLRRQLSLDVFVSEAVSIFSPFSKMYVPIPA